jgi:transposase InsO family protein
MMQPEGNQPSLTVEAACRAAEISRVAFYRHRWSQAEPKPSETALRDRIQRIALSNRCYGYRRVVAELHEQGQMVNHKRVRRILREDNLLSLRKRRYVLTTDSRHPYYVYPNLAGALTLTRINQLWVADITYIRLREQFLYLAVILDAHSRRVIGWQLGETLEAKLALAALDQALAGRQIAAGIVHHSDRGIQYCSREYTQRLEEHGFQISMSRKGNPYDNAQAESFMKTFKCEEVYLEKYRDKEHAQASIRHFLDQVYNTKRLHSALNYKSPVEFETAMGNEAKSE